MEDKSAICDICGHSIEEHHRHCEHVEMVKVGDKVSIIPCTCAMGYWDVLAQGTEWNSG